MNNCLHLKPEVAETSAVGKLPFVQENDYVGPAPTKGPHSECHPF